VCPASGLGAAAGWPRRALRPRHQIRAQIRLPSDYYDNTYSTVQIMFIAIAILDLWRGVAGGGARLMRCDHPADLPSLITSSPFLQWRDGGLCVLRGDLRFT
jgi:hypothetical protein